MGLRCDMDSRFSPRANDEPKDKVTDGRVSDCASVGDNELRGAGGDLAAGDERATAGDTLMELE